MDAFYEKWSQSLESQLSARVELLHFLFYSAGACKSAVPTVPLDTDLSDISDFHDRVCDAMLSGQYKGTWILARMDKQTGDIEAGTSLDDEFYPVHHLMGSKQKSLAIFRERFILFWDNLSSLAELEAFEFSNHGLLELVIEWLTFLSTTKWRPLRHVATLAAMRVLLSLRSRQANYEKERSMAEYDITKDRKTLEAMQRTADKDAPQFSSLSKSRNAGSDASNSIPALDSNASRQRLQQQIRDKESVVASLTARIGICCELATEVIDGICHHRYRDTHAPIRVDMVYGLGLLLHEHPTLHLTNAYLKYLGWMLNDRCPLVRYHCLEAIFRLYTLSQEQIASLSDFMTRFRERIGQMTRDSCENVSAAAIRVLHVALLADQLLEREVASVRDSLSSPFLSVRREAAALLLSFLPTFAPMPVVVDTEGVEADAADSGNRSKSRNKQNLTKAPSPAMSQALLRRKKEQLLALVEIALTLEGGMEQEVYNSTDHPSPSAGVVFLASAFWGISQASVLHAWNVYRDILVGTTETDGETEYTASDLNDTAIVLIFRTLATALYMSHGQSELDGSIGVPVASATEDEVLVTKHSIGRNGNLVPSQQDGAYLVQLTKNSDSISRFASSASSSLISFLSTLFSLYSERPAIALILCSITSMLIPSVFSNNQGASELKNLLYQIKRAYKTHTSPTVLSALASTLIILEGNGVTHARSRHVQDSIISLMQELQETMLTDIQKCSGTKEQTTGGNPRFSYDAMDVDDLTATQDEENTTLILLRSESIHMAVLSLRRFRLLFAAWVGSPLASSTPLKAFEFRDCTLTDLKLHIILGPVIHLLTKQCNLVSLFRAKNLLLSSKNGTMTDTDVLTFLSPALTSECISFMSTCLLHLFETAKNLCSQLTASMHGHSEDNLPPGALPTDELDEYCRNVCDFRDAILPFLFHLLTLRHPEVLQSITGNVSESISVFSNFLHTVPSPEDVTGSYVLPYYLSVSERQFIQQARQSAYESLTFIGSVFGSGPLQSTYLSPLIWIPTNVQVSLINTYVNEVFSSTDLATSSVYNGSSVAFGMDVGLSHVVASSDEVAKLTEEGLDEESLEAINSHIAQLEAEEEQDITQHIAQEIPLKEAETVRAFQKSTSILRETKSKLLSHARNSAVLQRLAELSIANPGVSRLGASVASRLVETISDAGPDGAQIAVWHTRTLRNTAPASLLTHHVRSLIDGTRTLVALLHVAESNIDQYESANTSLRSSERAEALAQAETAKENALQLCEQLHILVRKQIQYLGPRGNKALRPHLLAMIERGMKESLKEIPSRTPMLSLLAHYLILIPETDFRPLASHFERLLEESIDDTYIPIIRASSHLWSQHTKHNVPHADRFHDFPIKDLLHWVPIVAMLNVLKQPRSLTPSGTAVDSLQLYCGRIAPDLINFAAGRHSGGRARARRATGGDGDSVITDNTFHTKSTLGSARKSRKGASNARGDAHEFDHDEDVSVSRSVDDRSVSASVPNTPSPPSKTEQKRRSNAVAEMGGSTFSAASSSFLYRERNQKQSRPSTSSFYNTSEDAMEPLDQDSDGSQDNECVARDYSPPDQRLNKKRKEVLKHGLGHRLDDIGSDDAASVASYTDSPVLNTRSDYWSNSRGLSDIQLTQTQQMSQYSDSD